MKIQRSRLTIATVALLTVTLAYGLGAKLIVAQESESSSECIKCHTDLDKMDSYGAATSGGAAAIAG